MNLCCFIYCTCNSTFIQFLKLISSSSSFPLPSPYLLLCATQKNVEGVKKQTPSTGTHVPTPKPTLSLSSFHVLCGTRASRDIRRPEFQLRQCLKSACKVFSHSLPLSPQIHCRGKSCGDTFPLHFTAEKSEARDQGLSRVTWSLLSWSPSKSSSEPFLSWPSVSLLAKWGREVQLDGVNSVKPQAPKMFPYLGSTSIITDFNFLCKGLENKFNYFIVLFC